MNKQQRTKILVKTDGHCAYCGIELKERWQIDHVIPRNAYYRGSENKDINKESNLIASCQSCNNYKSNNTLEQFRKNLSKLFEQLERHSIYRISKRFNLIQEKEIKIQFYFEKLNRLKKN